MEFEGYKSVWLGEGGRAPGRSSASVTSQPMQFLRSSGMWDWERSREKSRVISSFLFAFAATIAALAALPSGTSPILSFCLAAALLIQGVIAAIGLARRRRDPDRSMRDYLTGEHRAATSQLRLELFSQVSLVIFTVTALVVVITGPRPEVSPERQVDSVASMVILTVLLTMSWLKARSVAWHRQVSQELEGYLREL